MSDNKFNPHACRVCLSHSYGEGTNLAQNEEMLQIFEFCIGFPIKLQHCSKILCLQCAATIKEFANFKRKCEKAEEFWSNPCNGNSTKCEVPKMEIKNEPVKCEKWTDSYILEDIFEYEDNNPNLNEPEINIEDLKFHVNVTKDTYNGTEIKTDQKAGNKFKCEKCNKEYSNNRWLEMHETKCSTDNNLDTNSNEDKIYKCGLCSMQASTADDLSTHWNDHWSNNDLKCKQCSFIGRDFADIVTHSFQHSKRKLFCPVCYKKKASVFSLQFHFRSVHLQKAGGLCSVCNKTFIKYKSWTKHERLHNEKNLFICDHCGRKYVFRHEIKSHLIHHSDERQFVCETCGNTFRRMSGLKDHIENVHSVSQPVKCNHCNKIYKNPARLQLHMKNIAKDKPFVCEICSKYFVSQKVLKKHMFWHTEERPFSCEVCGSRYKAKGQLNIHMRRHTGFMPHKCFDCGKGFPNSYQLKRHVSVHTGVRAHKCGLCERSFHEKKAFLEHSAQHKNVDDVKLET